MNISRTSLFSQSPFGPLCVLACVWLLLSGLATVVAVPMVLNYQGHLIEDGQAIEGDRQFKFVLLDGEGESLWSHDGSSVAGSEPDTTITLPLRRGVYAVGLGDETIQNMSSIPTEVVSANELFLRVWFVGPSGSQLLTPDQTVGSVAFALKAQSAQTVESIPEGLIQEKHLGAEFLSKLADYEDRISQLSESLTNLEAQVQATRLESVVTVSTSTQDTDLEDSGYELISTLNTVEWEYGTEEEPIGRVGHLGLWVGTRFLVWGGSQGGGNMIGSGSVYNVNLDTWTPLSPLDAPSARAFHSGVWTGEEMIVWGGLGTVGVLNTGARYHAPTQSWRPLPTSDAPSARSGHLSIWTGAMMIVYGGADGGGPVEDHGFYQPAVNQWRSLELESPPLPRTGMVGVWTGQSMLVWGGEDFEGYFGDGGVLHLTDGVPAEWVEMTSVNAPEPRSGHTAVWTGKAMLVWGGEGEDGVFDDGALYYPDQDRWEPVSLEQAPAPRTKHSAVWTGDEMLIHGGEDEEGAWHDSYAYDPETDQWRKLSEVYATARTEGTAVWTGEYLLTFGGYDFDGEIVPWLEYLEPAPIFHLYSKP